MADVIQLSDHTALLERDRQMFRMRIEGKSVREITDELNCSIADVHAAQHRMAAGVTPEFRQRILEVEIARLEALHKVFFKKGEEGDVEAGNWCIRRADRMSKWLGLDVMPRGDTVDDKTREPSSYEKITEVLMTLKYGPTIDGEAIEQPVEGKSE